MPSSHSVEGQRAQQSKGTQREEKPQDPRWAVGLGLCGGRDITLLPLKLSPARPADQGCADSLHHRGVEQNLQSQGCGSILVTLPGECVISEALHSEAGQSLPGPANPWKGEGARAALPGDLANVLIQVCL